MQFSNKIVKNWRILIFQLFIIKLFIFYFLFLEVDYYFFPSKRKFYRRTTPKNYYVKYHEEAKIILGWSKVFESTFEKFLRGKNVATDLNKCSYKCKISENRSDLPKSSIIFFHNEEFNINNLPQVNYDQINVFFNLESPYVNLQYKQMPKNFYNVTMTYRKDSHIRVTYDKFEKIDRFTGENEIWTWKQVQQKVAKKKKFVLQFVSHCSTPSKREEYVKELEKHINITIFGKCNRKNKCSKSCENDEIDDHMFYLAFENAICTDYITEKFWRLKQLIIPIILRRKIYEKVAPRGSFIAVDDFKSPLDLAIFLQNLSTHRNEYMKYFLWTKEYKKSPAILIDMCELCRIAWSRKRYTVDNLAQWWKEEAECIDNYAKIFLPQNNNNSFIRKYFS